VLLHTVRQRLRQIPPRTVVRQHLVPTRPLHCSCQRPRPGDLHLQRPHVPVGVLLQHVQVFLQQRPRPPLVQTRPGVATTGQPPPDRLQVRSQLGQYGDGPAQHVAVLTRRQLGQERDVDQLEYGAHPLPDVVAG
jgi:hypothetical protein